MPKTKHQFESKNLQKQLCSKLDIQKCLAKRVVCICDAILSNPIFEGIQREYTHQLSSISDLVYLEKNRTLFLKGSHIDHVYFVIRGRVKLASADNDSSKIFINQIIEQGEGIGLESLFGEFQYFHDTATTMEDSAILIIDKIALKNLISSNPVIMQNLLRYFSRLSISLSERLKDQVLTDVPERLFKYLQARSVTCSPKPSFPKAELAYILGTVPEVLSRAIKKLEEDGLIEVSKYSIKISD
ncbi:MAG: hypothetical protein RLZZ361_290 [Cyanobacteriota bacterium]|jgi:CRP/FNR family transcriptional regulator